MLRSAAFDATPGTDFAYHTLLSGTDDYKSGIYTENFDLTAGDYAIRFVASGIVGSPKSVPGVASNAADLSISMMTRAIAAPIPP